MKDLYNGDRTTSPLTYKHLHPGRIALTKGDIVRIMAKELDVRSGDSPLEVPVEDVYTRCGDRSVIHGIGTIGALALAVTFKDYPILSNSLGALSALYVGSTLNYMYHSCEGDERDRTKLAESIIGTAEYLLLQKKRGINFRDILDSVMSVSGLTKKCRNRARSSLFDDFTTIVPTNFNPRRTPDYRRSEKDPIFEQNPLD